MLQRWILKFLCLMTEARVPLSRVSSSTAPIHAWVFLSKTYASLFPLTDFHYVSAFLIQNKNKLDDLPHALIAFYEQASSRISGLKAFSCQPP